MVRLTAQQMVLQMVQRSAHLTARLMSQTMARQKAKLMCQLTTHCSEAQAAYQTAQWMVLQLAQCITLHAHTFLHLFLFIIEVVFTIYISRGEGGIFGALLIFFAFFTALTHTLIIVVQIVVKSHHNLCVCNVCVCARARVRTKKGEKNKQSLPHLLGHFLFSHIYISKRSALTGSCV